MDDQVLLPDRGEAVAGMIADALREPRIVRHEFQIGPIDGKKLRQLAQRQHPLDQEYLVIGDRERALHEAAKLGRHRRFHFEANGGTTTAALQRAFEQPHQVFGLFLDLDVEIADDAERSLPLDRVTRKQLRDEQTGCLLQRDHPYDIAVGLCWKADEPLDLLRHADERVHRPAVAGAREMEGDRKAEIGNERKRMRRIDRERRQNREDVLQEVVLEPGAIGLLQAVGFDQHDVRGLELFAQFAPARLLVAGEAGNRLANPNKLLARRQPIRALVGDPGAHLSLEARDPHHEEFIEVVGRDRKEPDLLEQRMLGVFSLFQNAAIEMQPGQLPVDESLGTTCQIGARFGGSRHRFRERRRFFF